MIHDKPENSFWSRHFEWITSDPIYHVMPKRYVANHSFVIYRSSLLDKFTYSFVGIFQSMPATRWINFVANALCLPHTSMVAYQKIEYW